jgi:hypothetical protein
MKRPANSLAANESIEPSVDPYLCVLGLQESFRRKPFGKTGPFPSVDGPGVYTDLIDQFRPKTGCEQGRTGFHQHASNSEGPEQTLYFAHGRLSVVAGTHGVDGCSHPMQLACPSRIDAGTGEDVDGTTRFPLTRFFEQARPGRGSQLGVHDDSYRRIGREGRRAHCQARIVGKNGSAPGHDRIDPCTQPMHLRQ